MNPTDRSTAPHYLWQQVCQGWRLLDRADLSVIEEQMPPGTSETPHRHAQARQLFYVLSGALRIDLPSGPVALGAGQAFEVAPGLAHQVTAPGPQEARFLVISAPSTCQDREEIGHAL